MFGLPILAYIAFNIDVLVAGKMVSTYLVGLYGMALTLAISPWDFFNGIISPVLLPAFSEKQGDKKALCKGVLRITKYTALFVIPPIVLALICGGAILTIIYGEKYSSVAVPFSLLCVYVGLLMQGGIFTSLFFSIGQPAKNRAFAIVRCLVLISLIYPAIRFFGLTGAAAVILLANFIALCLQITVIRRTIGLNIFDYVTSWLPGVVMAILVLVIIVVVRGLLPRYPMVHLIVGVLSCIVFCLSGLFLLRHFERQGRHLPGSTVSVGFASREDAQSV
jgi:O-antigen/teichoic acid export membrane protein